MTTTQNPASAAVHPTVELTIVHPDQALGWLESANTNNRKVSYRYVQRLARDMTEGRWRLTHAGIAFSPEGTLLDGQHRLWAIVTANVPIRLFVWRNVDPQAMMAIDSGKARSMADILNIAGQNGQVDHHDLATLRAMLGGFGDPPALSPAEMSEALRVHQDAIDFALTHLPTVNSARGVNTAPTRAVIARAYYHLDHAALRDFCRKLTSGVVTCDEEAVVVLLRQHLQLIRGNAYSHRMQRYGKVQRALSAWIKGENPSRLYPTTAEQFPLPEEVAA